MGFDEDGNYKISPERDSEKFQRLAAASGQAGGKPAPKSARPILYRLWSAPVRILLAVLLALILAVYSVSVAPRLIGEGKGEMPPAYNRILRALQFVLP